MLKMKTECLNCGTGLGHQDDAHICSYECTYCPGCAARLKYICKNCSGDLQPRPKRAAASAAEAT
ncbi:MAG: DUF1272 domain-containing protein [Gammaproteobacteria bacterium AqS3]|nr:DUF1272 domain-containing protein [Gammaproteobacteria bacterium AqS3]